MINSIVRFVFRPISKGLAWKGRGLWRRNARPAALVLALSLGWAGAVHAKLTLEPILAYNLIVDSNVLSPATYAPEAFSAGARICNRPDGTTGYNTQYTNITVYTGDHANDRPGYYPLLDCSSNFGSAGCDYSSYPLAGAQAGRTDLSAHLDNSGYYSFTHESGTVAKEIDATRNLTGLTLKPGDCHVEYWLVSYPNTSEDAKASWDAEPGSYGSLLTKEVSVTGGSIKPDDDLSLSMDFWVKADSDGNDTLDTTLNTTHTLTMRNEISAMANKIWPNGDNKVPTEYREAMQEVLGWRTVDIGQEPITQAMPGQTVIAKGVWYDLGVVGHGFDNDGDTVPDRNAWMQPIGDPSGYDPGCYRLVKTYGLVIIKMNDGTEKLYPILDTMYDRPALYHEYLPDDNRGAVGLVFYEYMSMDGVCTASLSPYQEVASGFDNEKFNGDYGADFPALLTAEPAATIDNVNETNDDPSDANQPGTAPDYLSGGVSQYSDLEVFDDAAVSTINYKITYENPKIQIIDGRLDMDGVGGITTDDDGSFSGYPIIDGYVDVDGDGVVGVDPDDDLVAIGGEEYAVIDGFIDVDGDGAAPGGSGDTGDDGYLYGADLGNVDYGMPVVISTLIPAGLTYQDEGEGDVAPLTMIDGYIDWDKDGTTAGDAGDDGTFNGYAIIDGRVDVDGDGNTSLLPDTDDDLEVFGENGYKVIDGLVYDSDGAAVLNANLITTTFYCTEGYRIIGGRVDIDQNGVIDANDNGSFGGYNIYSGYVDGDGSNAATGAEIADDVAVYGAEGYAVVNGWVDVDGDGVTNDGGDDGWLYDGAIWKTSCTAANVARVKWILSDNLPTDTQGIITWDATAPASGDTIKNNYYLNTAELGMGNLPPMIEDDTLSMPIGIRYIVGTVFYDDGTADADGTPSGARADGVRDAPTSGTANRWESGIPNVTVKLYIDMDGDGTVSDGDYLYDSTKVSTDDTGANNYAQGTVQDTATPSTLDDNDGEYAFSNLPAINNWLVVVDNLDSDLQADVDSDAVTEYGLVPTTAILIEADTSAVHKTGINFGFVEPLKVTKTALSSSVGVGEFVEFDITVQNVLPVRSGTPYPTGGCEYDLWATELVNSTTEGVTSGDWVNPDNALRGVRDYRYAMASYTGGSNQVQTFQGLDLTQLYRGPSGTDDPSQVRILFDFYWTGTVADDDLQFYISDTDVGNSEAWVGSEFVEVSTLAAYQGASNQGIYTQSFTSRPTYDQLAASQTDSFAVEAQKTGDPDAVTHYIDRVGVRVVMPADCLTTGSPNDTFGYVPLVDTFDDTKLAYVSASIEPKSVSGGTITWDGDDLAPIEAGDSVTIRVKFQALATATPTTNTATVTGDCETTDGATFENGLCTNSDEDPADVNIVDSAVIGDIVWWDMDQSGAQNGSEPGLNGVTVLLCDGTATCTWDGLGDPTSGNLIEHAKTQDLLIIDGGIDLNQDGVVNGLDDGQLQGVTISDGYLTGTQTSFLGFSVLNNDYIDVDGDNNGSSGSPDTDDDGAIPGYYKFIVTTAQSYQIAIDTRAAQGSDGFPFTPDFIYDVYDGAEGTGVSTIDMTVGNGGLSDVYNADFGVDEDADEVAMCGKVYEDYDGDGVWDTDEPGLGGATIQVYSSTDTDCATSGDNTHVNSGSLLHSGIGYLIETGSGGFDIDLDGDSDNSDDGWLHGWYFVNGGIDLNASGGISADDSSDAFGVEQKAIASGFLTDTTTTWLSLEGYGDFAYDGLAASTNYCVGVTLSTYLSNAGYVQTGDPDTTLDGMLTTTESTTAPGMLGCYNFGYQRQGTYKIGDFIYYDLDGDGTQETEPAGDPGIPNIPVYLYQDDDGDGIIDSGEARKAATTTSSGSTYAVINGLLDMDGDGCVGAEEVDNTCDGNAVNEDDGTFQGYPVIDGYIDVDADGNAGETDGTDDLLTSGVPPTLGTGQVEVVDGYVDLDGDSTTAADTGDTGSITEFAGYYLFHNIPTGNYVVVVDETDANFPASQLTQITDPDEDSQSGDWDNDTDVCGVVCDGKAAVYINATDGSDYAVDFGYKPANGAIGDTVYWDANNNGQQDSGERGIAGVTVNLVQFTHVFEYTVVAGQLDIDPSTGGDENGFFDGYPVYAGRIDVNGDGATNADDNLGSFGAEGYAIVQGYIDVDGDGTHNETTEDDGTVTDNGKYDAGEFIPEVSGVLSSRVTDSAGFYLFSGLGVSTITVIDGRLDLDGDGSIETNGDDDGYFNGLEVKNGFVDVDGDGATNEEGDDLASLGTAGYRVVDGYIDVDRDIATDDTGTAQSADTGDDGSITEESVFYGVQVDRGVGSPVENATLTADPDKDRDPSLVIDADKGWVADAICNGTDTSSVYCDGYKYVSLSGNSYMGADFGYLPSFYIGGYVWLDQDALHTQNTKEPGIGGVYVYLYKDNNNDNAYDAGDTLYNYAVTSEGGKSYQVIDGRLDTNGDGSITTADDGSFSGYVVIDGYLDIDGDGCVGTDETMDTGCEATFTAADEDDLNNDLQSGTTGGIGSGFYEVINGLVDIVDSGTVDTDDDGYIDDTGFYSFAEVPDGEWLIVVDTDTDRQFPFSLATATYDADDTAITTTPATAADNTIPVTLSGGSMTAPAGFDELDLDFGYDSGNNHISGSVCYETSATTRRGYCGLTTGTPGANNWDLDGDETGYGGITLYLTRWQDDGDGVIEKTDTFLPLGIESTVTSDGTVDVDGDGTLDRAGAYYFSDVPNITATNEGFVVSLQAPIKTGLPSELNLTTIAKSSAHSQGLSSALRGTSGSATAIQTGGGDYLAIVENETALQEVTLIGGALDLDGSTSITADDSGYFAGSLVASGRLTGASAGSYIGTQDYLIYVDGSSNGYIDSDRDGTDAPTDVGDVGTITFGYNTSTQFGFVSTDTDDALNAENITELDFAFTQMANFDYGDLPITTVGDQAPFTAVRLNQEGARHIIPPTGSTVWLGDEQPVADDDGTPSDTATGDDENVNPDTVDEENGFNSTDWGWDPLNGGTATITVNGSASNGYIVVFVDFNRDGKFTAAEMVIYDTVPNSRFGEPIDYAFDVPANTKLIGDFFARVRVFKAPPGVAALTFKGVADDGEVEDQLINFVWDMGDAPASYNTWYLPSDDTSDKADSYGAMHLNKTSTPTLYLGTTGPDTDTDGQPVTADGDDNNVGCTANCDGGDEDGLVSIGTITGPGDGNTDALIRVKVTNSGSDWAVLAGWMDWNCDGDFNDANERSEPGLAYIDDSSANILINLDKTGYGGDGDMQHSGGYADATVTDGLIDISAANSPLTGDIFSGYTLTEISGGGDLFVDVGNIGTRDTDGTDDVASPGFGGYAVINGYIDIDGDGCVGTAETDNSCDGNDVNEDDGTVAMWYVLDADDKAGNDYFDDGNIPPGVTDVEVGLYWDASPNDISGTTCETYKNDDSRDVVSYLRLRLTSDADFLSDNSPTPDGAAGDGEVEDHGTDLTPTYAAIDAFDAYTDRGRGVVYWRTSGEIDTLGYYLERLDPDSGEFIRLNSSPLPAAYDAQRGGEYRFVDAGAVPGQHYVYRLVEKVLDGGAIVYGPYSVRVAGGGNLVQANGYQRNERAIEAGAKRRLDASNRERRVNPGGKPTLEGAFKVSVKEKGIHTLDADTIAGLLGLRKQAVTQWMRNGEFVVSHAGASVPTTVDEETGNLLFYAEEIDSPYTEENVYWVERASGLRNASMQELDGGMPSEPGYNTTRESLRLEENNVYYPNKPYDNQPEDFWYWNYLYTFPGYNEQSYTFDAPGVIGDWQNTLKVNMQGMNNTVEAYDHRVEVELNGVKLTTAIWDGDVAYTARATLPSALLWDEGNVLTLRASAPATGYSFVTVDSIEVDYARTLTAVNGELEFTAGSRRVVSVDGFTSDDVWVFDVTDPSRTKRITGVHVAQGDAGNRIDFVPPSGGRYLAIEPSAWNVVGEEDLADDKRENLRDITGAEHLVIVPEFMRDAAEELADYRRDTGMRSLVVTAESIYDEFGYGIRGSEAIEKFLEYAWENWRYRPGYAVLIGKGSVDETNRLGVGGNLLPVRMSQSGSGAFAADIAYGDVSGNDGVPEIAVGRLPALSGEEVRAYVAKLRKYEASGGKWEESVVLAADLNDRAGAFDRSSDYSASVVPEYLDVTRLYRSQDTAATVRQGLVRAFHEGALMINYQGHAGYYELGRHGTLLNTADVNLMQGQSTFPLLTSMTCVLGRFELPGVVSLGEELVMAPDGGAIATYSPSGLSDGGEAAVVNKAFMQAYFQDGKRRLGDIVISTQSRYGEKFPDKHMQEIYGILGDPATLIR